MNIGLLLVAAGIGIWLIVNPTDALAPKLFPVVIGLALLFGVLLVIPIGGADMPVVICLLNSYSGLAAMTTGFVLGNKALIITGSLVGASGIILTMIMCKAMNRSLLNVVAGGFGTGDLEAGAVSATTAGGQIVRRMDAEEAAMVLEGANNVIIVPGYGMAVAQAQHVVAELANEMIRRGANVRFAIHPVAGRMPGHMNILLAEANVPYDLLSDLAINPEFDQCDVAIVIGANDVVNPAARHNKSSPIYGMPILDVDKARSVMVCKRSLNPGFAGIENELFVKENTVMLFGDAKKMVTSILTELKGAA
jgi:NAD(P) transhydrogenase subunit beta